MPLAGQDSTTPQAEPKKRLFGPAWPEAPESQKETKKGPENRKQTQIGPRAYLWRGPRQQKIDRRQAFSQRTESRHRLTFFDRRAGAGGAPWRAKTPLKKPHWPLWAPAWQEGLRTTERDQRHFWHPLDILLFWAFCGQRAELPHGVGSYGPESKSHLRPPGPTQATKRSRPAAASLLARAPRTSADSANPEACTSEKEQKAERACRGMARRGQSCACGLFSNRGEQRISPAPPPPAWPEGLREQKIDSPLPGQRAPENRKQTQIGLFGPLPGQRAPENRK